MKRKIISVRCQGADLLSLSLLNPLQGDLKELSEARKNKLKNSLIEKGFWFPFFVWKCDQENKIYYIDGHQRDKVLPELEAEGYELPEKYPVVFIEAKNKMEAIEAILLQTSQYGIVDSEELYNIVNENELDLKRLENLLEIPGIDLSCLDTETIDKEIEKEVWQGMPEFENDDAGPIQSIIIHFGSKDDINSFQGLVNQEITDKTKFLWYPKKKILI